LPESDERFDVPTSEDEGSAGNLVSYSHNLGGIIAAQRFSLTKF
jgi:hypothetical protein